MAYKLDTAAIDEIHAHFVMFADAVERMIVSKNVAVARNIHVLTETVADAKLQLGELAACATLDDKLFRAVLNLVDRYRNLEGRLKELRNDQLGAGVRSQERARSLQKRAGDGEQK